MSSYSDYLKERKSKDLKCFFGEDIKMISNKYFKFTHVIDNDSIILITNNIKIIKVIMFCLLITIREFILKIGK